MVAGEASGDILGAAVLNALTARGISFEALGVGGPRMQDAGFNTLHDMERLSVMGLIDPLLRLAELLSIRRSLRSSLPAANIDVFLGIDAPDFNLGLEIGLRSAGIPVAHLVSPSVWAWRRGRIRKIARAVDRMLTLFPFEEDVYRDEQIPVTCVGHPLADQIPMSVDRWEAREQLGIAPEATVIGLLPGSRTSEIKSMGGIFLRTMMEIQRTRSDVQFVLPAADATRRAQLEELLPEDTHSLLITDGESQRVMAASDGLLMASGTATLEAMLLKRPMVVAYRMGALSYAIISRLLHTPHIALPNLLAGTRLVPEYVQADATPEKLASAVLSQLENEAERQRVVDRFTELHSDLRRNAGDAAATAVVKLAGVVVS